MSQAAAQVEQQDRQQRHSTSSLSAPLSTTDTIIVNVAGTRYSVGESAIGRLVVKWSWQCFTFSYIQFQ